MTLFRFSVSHFVNNIMLWRKEQTNQSPWKQTYKVVIHIRGFFALFCFLRVFFFSLFHGICNFLCNVMWWKAFAELPSDGILHSVQIHFEWRLENNHKSTSKWALSRFSSFCHTLMCYLFQRVQTSSLSQ